MVIIGIMVSAGGALMFKKINIDIERMKKKETNKKIQ